MQDFFVWSPLYVFEFRISMTFLDTFLHNLLSPALLFFVLGILAAIFESDLSVPESIRKYLCLYLMMAIGFRGGVEMATTPQLDFQALGMVCAGIAASFLLPFLGYALLRGTTKLDCATAAAVSAHYGSISVVTFATATSFLGAQGLTYAGYVIAIMALMEAPAVLSGLFIAHRARPDIHTCASTKGLYRTLLTNGSVLLLLGSFAIGWTTGEVGMHKVSGFLETPFQGFLCLFLLDMGMLVAKHRGDLKKFTLPMFLFGLYMPLIGASLGLSCAYFFSLDVGTGTLFTVLCASASYIAVPAAMRLSLPQASAPIYISMSLGITFPFNIALGIPVYAMAARALLGGQ